MAGPAAAGGPDGRCRPLRQHRRDSFRSDRQTGGSFQPGRSPLGSGRGFRRGTAQGSELGKATVDDIEETAGGRLIVRTKGLKARLVPIRLAHTDLVREALDHAHTGRFIKTTGRNSVYRISSALDTGDGKGLSLRRARSTWLLAHLVAGTSLPALRWLAGSLSANTLAELLPEAADLLDNETAVTEGLRA